MPERTRVAPSRLPAPLRPGDGPAVGRVDARVANERLTLIEFTWIGHGRVQPVLFVSRELLH